MPERLAGAALPPARVEDARTGAAAAKRRRASNVAALGDRSWRHEVVRRVVHEPLFDTHTSLIGLRRAEEGKRPRSILVGIGLCTQGALSRAVPLDVLGMLLPAEVLRRRLEAKELLVLIADRHALDNGFDPEGVKARAQAVERVLERIRAQCRIPSLRVVRASDYHDDGAYLRTLDRVRAGAPDLHDYVRRQFADVLYLERERGPLLKVGWSLPSADPLRQRDELMLDETMARTLGARLGFVYCKPARTLADASPRMSPYVVKRPEARLCLDRAEDPEAKLRAAVKKASPDTVAAFRRHLRRLVYTYSRVVEPLPRGELEVKVAAVVDRLGAPE